MNLRAIQTLVAVVEAGSITRAASQLGTSQPAVSMALRDLEDELGVVLIDRGTRPLRPTHAGFALYHRATRLVADVEALATAVRSVSAEKVATLRVGLVVPCAPNMVRKLRQTAREVEIRTGLTPDLLRALVGHELDIVITSDAAEEVEGLDRQRLVREPFVAVLPRDRTARTANLVRLAADLPLVRYTARSAIGTAIERYLRRHAIESPHRFEFDSSETVLTTVQAGLGWTITTPLCIAQARCELSSFRIVELPHPAWRQLYVLHRRDEHEAAAGKIRALVAQHMQALLRATFGARHWIHEQVEVADEPRTGTRAASAVRA